MSCPPYRTWPSDGSSRPMSIFTVVLFPEPFGPRYPSTCPGIRQKLMLRTAGTEPYDLESTRASSMGPPFTPLPGSRIPLTPRAPPKFHHMTLDFIAERVKLQRNHARGARGPKSVCKLFEEECTDL